MSIAYATLDHLLKNIRCRTLFATHYHELATMLTNPDDGKVREGVDFYCTDVNEGVCVSLYTLGRS
jgi:DNA mismatch repair ATPase MutS